MQHRTQTAWMWISMTPMPKSQPIVALLSMTNSPICTHNIYTTYSISKEVCILDHIFLHTASKSNSGSIFRYLYSISEADLFCRTVNDMACFKHKNNMWFNFLKRSTKTTMLTNGPGPKPHMHKMNNPHMHKLNNQLSASVQLISAVFMLEQKNTKHKFQTLFDLELFTPLKPI